MQELKISSKQEMEHNWGYREDQFEIKEELIENGKLKVYYA